jgi:outer membrane murein-binding lipoprotein Lpp
MIPYGIWALRDEALAEIAAKNAEIARLGRCNEQISHTHAVVVNELNAAITRLLQELDACREQLREQTKSFCTHCGKLFPAGKEGLAAFRLHVAECNAHPLCARIDQLETRLRAIHENTQGADGYDLETARWKLQLVHDASAYKE